MQFGGSDAWLRVVGIVSDIRHLGPSTPPRPEFYQPGSQRSFPFMAFVVRTEGEPYGVVPAIRRAVAELDPAMPLAGLRTMDEHVARALARPRFYSTLIGAFGALAVTLALIGIYAMMAWSVSERRQEFAIRTALGASGRTLVAMVLRKAVVLAGSGILAGLVLARIATGVLTGLLHGVRPTDPSTFALTAVAVALVALAACYIPARRVMRVDPVSALR
jgi:putative ABC transport system permease protein